MTYRKLIVTAAFGLACFALASARADVSMDLTDGNSAESSLTAPTDGEGAVDAPTSSIDGGGSVDAPTSSIDGEGAVDTPTTSSDGSAATMPPDSGSTTCGDGSSNSEC